MTSDQRTFSQKANAIRDLLDHDVHQDDMPGLQEKLLKLTSIKRAELIAYASHKSEKLQPTVFKVVIEGECADEYGKLELADRLNAGLTHCMESIRTIISAKKEEMKSTLMP